MDAAWNESLPGVLIDAQHYVHIGDTLMNAENWLTGMNLTDFGPERRILYSLPNVTFNVLCANLY